MAVAVGLCGRCVGLYMAFLGVFGRVVVVSKGLGVKWLKWAFRGVVGRVVVCVAVCLCVLLSFCGSLCGSVGRF